MSWASSRRTGSWIAWGITAPLILAFVGQGLAAMMANSQTFDEGAHFASGYAYWATGDFRINAEDPPLVKELCLLPVYLLYDLPLDTDSALWHEADQFRIGFELLYGREGGGSLSSPQGDNVDVEATSNSAQGLARQARPTDAHTLLNVARLPNLLLGACVVVLVGWWSYRLWGPAAGLLAMAVAALEPTLVAHSTFLTTDVGWTLFCTATLYAVWEFCRSGSWKWLVALGIASGLALGSKFSAVSLIGMLPVVMGCYWLTGGGIEWLGRKKRNVVSQGGGLATLSPHAGSVRLRMGGQVLQILLALAAVGYIALLVVWAAYYFQDPMLWWDGLQQQLRHLRFGHSAWFWGEYSQTGWPEYFFVALGVKTQIATLVLAAVSLVGFARSGSSNRTYRRDGLVFVVLPLTMFLAALVFARINIGVRHALHVYPLLFVLAGRVATMRTTPAWIGRAGIGVLVAASAFSAWRIAPYPVAYFNEAAGGPEGGRRILADSNLDWGQGLLALADYVEQEGLDGIYLSYFGTAPPESFGVQYQYVPAFGPLSRPEPWRVGSAGDETSPFGTRRSGTRRSEFPTQGGTRRSAFPTLEVLAISDGNLKGTYFANHERYAWLAERAPVATLAHSIYVYDITDDAEAHFELARVYLEGGRTQDAAWEVEKVLALDAEHDGAKRSMDSLSTDRATDDWGGRR